MAARENANVVETVALAIAKAAGSRVFGPLHDTLEHQAIRNKYRDLAEAAIALTLDES